VHHYPKDAVWNADDSYAITSDRKLWDGRTYAYLRTVVSPPGTEHDTWSNVVPRYIYGASKAARQWTRVDVVANTWTVLKTYSAADVGLPTLSTMSYGLYEGNMDDADTGAVLVADGVRPVLIDPPTGAVRCYVTSGGGYGRSVSDATMSQDGKWILVNWLGYGVDAYHASSCSFARKLTSRNSHYDACVSTAGEQVVVQFDTQLKMTRISDGTSTSVYSDVSWIPGHVTCRNTRRPGWAYVSTGSLNCAEVSGERLYHRIFSVKLDGSQQVENWAWDHAPCPIVNDPGDVPYAVPSRDGSRVWWKTNWDGVAGARRSYVARKP
jgi:hypothetical protein